MPWPKGKPRKQAQEQAPLADIAPIATKTGRKKHKQVTKEMVEALVVMTNTMIQFVPALRGDALDETEAALLVDALYQGAKANRYLANLIHLLTTVNANSKTFVTIGAITARRLARHDVLPRAVDAQAGALLGIMAMTRTEPPKRGRPPKQVAEVYTDEGAVADKFVVGPDDPEYVSPEEQDEIDEMIHAGRRAKRGA